MNLPDIFLNFLSSTENDSLNRFSEVIGNVAIPIIWPEKSAEKPIWTYNELANLNGERLAERALRAYAGVEGKFDWIVVGSCNGGAATLAAMLGVPYLPSQLTIEVLSSHSDLFEYDKLICDWGKIADAVHKQCPNSEVILHYDPDHDKNAIQLTAMVRIRFLELPKAYMRFISERLNPGGKILFLDVDCKANQIELENDIWFQVFTEQKMNLEESILPKHMRERLSAENILLREEAEWGGSQKLNAKMLKFKNCVFATCSFPEDLGDLAAETAISRNRRLGISQRKLFICTHRAICPIFAASDWIVYWLPFVDKRSFDSLKRFFIKHDLIYDSIILMLDLGIGSDIVPEEQWRGLISEYSNKIRIFGVTGVPKSNIALSEYKKIGVDSDLLFKEFYSLPLARPTSDDVFEAGKALGIKWYHKEKLMKS